MPSIHGQNPMIDINLFGTVTPFEVKDLVDIVCLQSQFFQNILNLLKTIADLVIRNEARELRSHF